MIIEEKSWQQNIVANNSEACCVSCILNSRQFKEKQTWSIYDR